MEQNRKQTTSHGELKLLQEIAHEVLSLQSEGYRLLHEYKTDVIVCTAMQHKSNGNRIDIAGYPKQGHYYIKKNRVIVKERRI